MLAPMRRRSRPVLLFAALAMAAMGSGCKRRDDARATDAGMASTAKDASGPLVPLDGFFAATLTAGGEPLVVASASRESQLGLVSFDAAGRPSTTPLRIPTGASFKMISGVTSFADGRVLAVVADVAGGLSGAMLGADGALGPFAPVGVESCATADTFYFVDRDAAVVRTWRAGAGAPSPVQDPRGTKVGDGATLQCGKRVAFAMEARKRGVAMTVLADGATPRHAELAKTLDPTSSGDFAAFVTDDRAGLVYAGDDDVMHVAYMTDAGAVTDRAWKRKLGASESIVGADARGDDVVALVQHEEKGRCGDEETPPAYTVLDLGRERAFALPKVTCDVESSPPVLEIAGDRMVVRWFESKDDGHDKRLRQWSLAVGEANERAAAVTSTPVPDATSLLDCTTRCTAIAREAATFRVVTTL